MLVDGSCDEHVDIARTQVGDGALEAREGGAAGRFGRYACIDLDVLADDIDHVVDAVDDFFARGDLGELYRLQVELLAIV